MFRKEYKPAYTINNMLKEGVYDSFTVIDVILIIATVLLLTTKNPLTGTNFYIIIICVMLYTYRILILTLGIELYGERETQLYFPVLAAILSPLAPFFYLFILRKPFTEYSQRNPHKINIFGNVPGSP